MVHALPRICHRERDARNSLRFWDTNRSSNLGPTIEPSDSQKKKKKKKKKEKKEGNLRNSGLCANHRVKQKENEKRYKYQELARELKKLGNMKVTEILIVIGALGTVTKGLVQGLEDSEMRRRVEIIQTTAILRSARILRRVLETFCQSNSSEKPSANAGVKNYQNCKIIIIIMIRLLARRPDLVLNIKKSSSGGFCWASWKSSRTWWQWYQS